MTMITTSSQHPVEPEELMAYLDGELSPARAAETASHLEGCTDCRKLAVEFQEISQMLLSWQIEESEVKLAEEVTGALEKREAQPTGLTGHGAWHLLSPRYWPKPVWGLAIVGVIVAALWISTSHLTYTPMSDLRTEVKDGNVAAPPQGATRTPAKMPHGQPQASATPGPGLFASETLQQRHVNGNLQAGADQISQISIPPAVNGPMIVRTAELALTTNKFDQARGAVEEILKRHKGYVGELNVNTPTGSARSLTGALRVPAAQLDAALADFKTLGRV